MGAGKLLRSTTGSRKRRPTRHGRCSESPSAPWVLCRRPWHWRIQEGLDAPRSSGGGVGHPFRWTIQFFGTMNPPTADQAKWAVESWDYVSQTYEEWTRAGFHDFRPMLRLIGHIRTSCDVASLSAGTSLAHLLVASAAHVESPNNLADSAPVICVTQRELEFEFRDAKGRRRKCPFDQGPSVFDTQLVRLGMMVEEYERRAPKSGSC